MIAALRGKVAEKLLDVVVLEVGGVGYGLLVTSEDAGALATGQEAKLYVYEHIRENVHDLFGFRNRETQQLFEQLLAVNGVGPKMALSILSIASADQVRRAIASGDTKFIARASGVGKRVAERIVVDLRDKVGLEGAQLSGTGLLASEQSISNDDAAEALISLGYSPADAAKALRDIDKNLPSEERIKLALRKS
jgi:Holliday junction DNA helicase RuvA